MSEQVATPAASSRKHPIVIALSLLLALGVGAGVFFGLQAMGGGNALLDAEAGQCVSLLPLEQGASGGELVECTDPAAILRVIYVFHDKGIADVVVDACGNLVTGATRSFVPDLDQQVLLCLGAV